MDVDPLENSRIPKITHQIWFQGWDKVPEKYHENIRQLEALNPEFQHMRWDETSLRRECELLGAPYVKKFDSMSHMIMKVDYGRYVVLYRYGGISIDMDMKPMRPLRETPGLASEELIVSKLPNPVGYTGYVNNAMFAAVPKCSILKEIVDSCTKSTKRQEDYSAFELYLNEETGPEFINKQLAPHWKRIKVLDSEFFEPCYSADVLCTPGEKTIADHRHSLSWIDSSYHWIFKLLFLLYRALPILILLGVAWAYFYWGKKAKRSIKA
jgi:mannosyltransferase OCH1-like enzyme